jgi:exonuclease III
MLLFSWNVRGLNSPLKQHELVRLMQKHKFDVCGLLETKLSSSKLQFMHRFRLKRWKLVSNVEAASTARVIVLWNPSTVHVDVLDSSPQCIHVSIRCLSSHLTFAASFVYGYNTISGRRTLWDGLKSWASTGPWLVLGDFNSTLSQDDKYNGEPVSSYEVSDFRACCLELGLSYLNYTGCHYTWSNGTVWTKIDLVLANPSWNNLQLTSHVHFQPPGAFSDHHWW